MITSPKIANEKVRQEALSFLRSHKTATVATVSSDGQPHAAVVTCLFDDAFNIYFFTQRNSRKFENIDKNPHVAFVVGGDEKTLSTIQMEGTAEIIDDPQRLIINYDSKSIQIIDAPWQPLLKSHDIDFAFLKVTTTWARWMKLNPTESSPETYDQEFHEIIARV